MRIHYSKKKLDVKKIYYWSFFCTRMFQEHFSLGGQTGTRSFLLGSWAQECDLNYDLKPENFRFMQGVSRVVHKMFDCETDMNHFIHTIIKLKIYDKLPLNLNLFGD